MNTPGSPRVQAKSASLTTHSGAKNDPNAFWHMRQWQMDDLIGST